MDAEKTSTFYKKIVDLVDPYIKEKGTALDIGCGTGPLAAELARRGLSVTAIDKSAPAIAVLKRRAENEKLYNLKAISLDFEKLPSSEQYDMVFVCYIMGLIKTGLIDKVLNHGREYVTIILPAEETKKDFSVNRLIQKLGLDTSRLKQRCCKDVIKLLRERGVDYRLEFFEAEFGQYFKDMGEAKEFLKYYFRELEKMDGVLEEWLAGELRHVYNRGYYLPSTRRSAVFILMKGRG
jgi:SAM-dependent methyltransferase